MGNSFTRIMIVILLVIAAILSYVDRGNLSVVQPQIAEAFQLNHQQLGWLASAFFWSYAFFQIIVGWGADRYSPKWLFAWGFFIWTLSTLATGFVNGFVLLFTMRLLLGVGESVVYPAVSRILVEYFPDEKRGLPNALIAAGTKIGPAISIAIAGPILRMGDHSDPDGSFIQQCIATVGPILRMGNWRGLFILTGIVSFLWLIPWILFVPNMRTKPGSNTGSQGGVGFGELMGRREFWGTTIGFFCFGYAIYFLISWLPSYLEEGRHFSKEQMIQVGQIPFWVMGAVTIFCGFVSDGLIQRGASPTISRLTFIVGGLSLCAVSLLAVPYASSDSVCLRYLAISCTGLGMFSSNAWAVTQTLAGSHAAGKWSGVQNAIGNLGGAGSAIITGMIHQQTGNYDYAFFLAAGILVVGIMAYAVMVGRVQEVEWIGREAPQPSTV